MGEKSPRCSHHAQSATGPEQPPKPVLVQRATPSPGVAILAFNRPEKRNALSQSLIDEFLDELATASADPAIKAVILTGGPHVFSGKSGSGAACGLPAAKVVPGTEVNVCSVPTFKPAPTSMRLHVLTSKAREDAGI